jgi:hypothetical protein
MKGKTVQFSTIQKVFFLLVVLLLVVGFVTFHIKKNDFKTYADYPAGAFVTTWRVDEDGGSVTIPTTGAGYNYNVDWACDGTWVDTGVDGDRTHTYTEAGTYDVCITGTFPRIYFNDSGDKLKIIDIKQWGGIGWTSMVNAFKGATNLNVTATDAPDFTNTTSLAEMFSGCSSLVGNASMGSWNVSTITNMQEMFKNTSFNQDISSWNITGVTNFTSFLDGSAMSSTNYDLLLTGWNTKDVQSNVTFGATGITYYSTEAATARDNLRTVKLWTITDDGQNNPPHTITLFPTSIDENTTEVGTFSVTDEHPSTVTYSLVAGTGDEDNAKFSINSTTKKLSFITAPDYETPTDQGDTAENNTYAIRVKATDDVGQFVEATFIITVLDVDEIPPTVTITSDAYINNTNKANYPLAGTCTTGDA